MKKQLSKAEQDTKKAATNAGSFLLKHMKLRIGLMVDGSSGLHSETKKADNFEDFYANYKLNYQRHYATIVFH